MVSERESAHSVSFVHRVMVFMFMISFAIVFIGGGASKTFSVENLVRSFLDFRGSILQVVGSVLLVHSFNDVEEIDLQFSVIMQSLKTIRSHNEKGLQYKLVVNECGGGSLIVDRSAARISGEAVSALEIFSDLVSDLLCPSPVLLSEEDFNNPYYLTILIVDLQSIDDSSFRLGRSDARAYLRSESQRDSLDGLSLSSTSNAIWKRDQSAISVLFPEDEFDLHSIDYRLGKSDAKEGLRSSLRFILLLIPYVLIMEVGIHNFDARANERSKSPSIFEKPELYMSFLMFLMQNFENKRLRTSLFYALLAYADCTSRRIETEIYNTPLFLLMLSCESQSLTSMLLNFQSLPIALQSWKGSMSLSVMLNVSTSVHAGNMSRCRLMNQNDFIEFVNKEIRFDVAKCGAVPRKENPNDLLFNLNEVMSTVLFSLHMMRISQKSWSILIKIALQVRHDQSCCKYSQQFCSNL